jgi:hypothetical protein
MLRVNAKSAGAARFAPVPIEEILVAPGLEARVVIRIVAVASCLERCVELASVLVVWMAGV